MSKKTTQTMFRNKIKNAQQRGIEFKLTRAQYDRIMANKICAYTGLECDNNTEMYKVSLERVDSTKGYVVGNVIPCMRVVNSIKNNRDTLPELKELLLIKQSKYDNFMRSNQSLICYYNKRKDIKDLPRAAYDKALKGKAALDRAVYMQEQIVLTQSLIDSFGKVKPWSYYTKSERLGYYIDNIKTFLTSMFKWPKMA